MGWVSTGIKVRAVDPTFKVVEGATVATDSEGNFQITGLPDGSYMAYVYVNDNPHFFNRASTVATVKGGQEAQLQPITLGRIITPVSPNPGEAIVPREGGFTFSWSACSGAASYQIAIKRHGYVKPVVEMTSAKPSAKVNLSKLVPGAVYEVQVTAKNADGEFLGTTNGAGLKAWTFRTRG